MSQVVKLYIGPMRSGKTTAMYSDVERHYYAKRTTVIIKYLRDTYRNETSLSTHSQFTLDKIKTISCDKHLMSVIGDMKDVSVIGIDEVQFYEDAPEFVQLMASQGKSVYMSGLDSDFKGRLFGRIAELLPVCDRVEKLSAVCDCGKDALYTSRVGSSEEIELIGGMYKSSCRECFSGYVLRTNH